MKRLLTFLLFVIGFIAVFLVSSMIAFNSFPTEELTEVVDEVPLTGNVNIFEEETGDGVYTIVTPALQESKTVVTYGSREDAVPVNKSQSVSVDIESFYTPEVVTRDEKKDETKEDDKKAETEKTEEKKTEEVKKEETKKEETKKEETKKEETTKTEEKPKEEEKTPEKVEETKEEEKAPEETKEEAPKEEEKAPEVTKEEEKPKVELDPDKQYSDTGL